MHLRDVRLWVVLNALLLLAILVLLVLLLFGQQRHVAAVSSVDNDYHGAPTVVPREVDARRVGLRPVSFSRIVFSAETAEGWRVRGVQAQEWARLPASPGMDMAEMPDGYLLTFSLPGVQNDDIRLSMTGSVVTVQAIVRDPHGAQVGGLERRVRLPRTPNVPAEFKAIFTNGVLRICVAK